SNVTTSSTTDISTANSAILARLDKMERMLSTICMMMDIDMGDASPGPPPA
ncbi:hypothetical protein TorRG33x02_325600, partial [Trema orientale]